MPRVTILHRTTDRYGRPIRFGDHRPMVRPRDSHDLRLISATLAAAAPARLRWKDGVFGTSIAIASFAEESEILGFVSTIEVGHYPAAPLDVASLIEPYAETHPFAYAAEETDDLAPDLRRHDSDPNRTVDLWAKSFRRAEGPTRTADLLVAITRAIRADFRLRGTGGGRNAARSGDARETQGACRDFALLMMEACRSLGLAARFVSGYLYDDRPIGSENPMVGGGATHAWCEVYLPGAGWVEFEPTNGLLAGRNLIRVAVTRTPEQAAPISGTFFGEAADFRGLEVAVDVTVAALPGEIVQPISATGKGGQSAPA
ncbi:MAG: transglutaminase family protein [Elioraea sp.]|nr:transglutaminase family protein [Elioraea sp.]